MTLYRVYGQDGTKTGVLDEPDPIKGQDTKLTLYLPNNRLFERYWTKAIERPVVLDTPPEPIL